MINVPGRLEKASQKRWHSSQIMKGGQKFIKQKKDVHMPPEMLHVLRPTEAQCFGGMVRDSGCWNTGFMQGSDRNERAVGNKSQILSTAHKGKILLIPFYQGRKKNELSQHHIPAYQGDLCPVFCLPRFLIAGDQYPSVPFFHCLLLVLCLFSISSILGALLFQGPCLVASTCPWPALCLIPNRH